MTAGLIKKRNIEPIYQGQARPTSMWQIKMEISTDFFFNLDYGYILAVPGDGPTWLFMDWEGPREA